MQIPKEALENFTEDALTVSYNCSFEEVRKAKVKAGLQPELPVSLECLREIRLLSTSITIDHAAYRYNCTTSDILRAYYHRRPRNSLSYPLLDELKPWFATGASFEELAKVLNCSVRHLQKNYKLVRKELTGRDRLSEEAKAELVATLASKETSQLEIAEQYGVSQATVSRLNPNKTKRREYNYLKDDVWEELLIKIRSRELTISEASRNYNISRPSIYKRLT